MTYGPNWGQDVLPRLIEIPAPERLPRGPRPIKFPVPPAVPKPPALTCPECGYDDVSSERDDRGELEHRCHICRLVWTEETGIG